MSLPPNPKRYKLVVCPYCGYIQVTESYRTFKCRRCGRTKKMHLMWKEGYILYESDDYSELVNHYRSKSKPPEWITYEYR